MSRLRRSRKSRWDTGCKTRHPLHPSGQSNCPPGNPRSWSRLDRTRFHSRRPCIVWTWDSRHSCQPRMACTRLSPTGQTGLPRRPRTPLLPLERMSPVHTRGTGIAPRQACTYPASTGHTRSPGWVRTSLSHRASRPTRIPLSTDPGRNPCICSFRYRPHTPLDSTPGRCWHHPPSTTLGGRVCKRLPPSASNYRRCTQSRSPRLPVRKFRPRIQCRRSPQCPCTSRLGMIDRFHSVKKVKKNQG